MSFAPAGSQLRCVSLIPAVLSAPSPPTRLPISFDGKVRTYPLAKAEVAAVATRSAIRVSKKHSPSSKGETLVFPSFDYGSTRLVYLEIEICKYVRIKYNAVGKLSFIGRYIATTSVATKRFFSSSPSTSRLWPFSPGLCRIFGAANQFSATLGSGSSLCSNCDQPL